MPRRWRSEPQLFGHGSDKIEWLAIPLRGMGIPPHFIPDRKPGVCRQLNLDTKGCCGKKRFMEDVAERSRYCVVFYTV